MLWLHQYMLQVLLSAANLTTQAARNELHFVLADPISAP